MNRRFKAAREAIGLSQKKLADRIGISDGALSKIESGINSPSERTIKLLCSEFSVSERWLRAGEGEMFAQCGGSDELDALCDKYGFGDMAKSMMHVFVGLSEEHKTVIRDYLKECVERTSSIKLDPAAALEARIDAEAEEYKRQRLLEEKAKGGSSRSADGNVSEIG